MCKNDNSESYHLRDLRPHVGGAYNLSNQEEKEELSHLSVQELREREVSEGLEVDDGPENCQKWQGDKDYYHSPVWAACKVWKCLRFEGDPSFRISPCYILKDKCDRENDEELANTVDSECVKVAQPKNPTIVLKHQVHPRTIIKIVHLRQFELVKLTEHMLMKQLIVEIVDHLI